MLKLKRCVTWTALLIVALLVSTQAADLDAGLEAYKLGDYEAALSEFRPLAEQGDMEAQFWLGVMYEYGRGPLWNPVESVYWYRKAAEGGHTKAQIHLGILYRDGHVVPKNRVEAYAWFDNAAAQGNKNAERARDELAESMSPDAVARAKDLAAKYREAIP